MAVMDLHELKNNLVGLGQRKVKTVYLLLALSAAFSLLVLAWAFTTINHRNDAPGSNPTLPSGTGEFHYRYAILGENENMLLKPMDVIVASDRVYVTDTLNTRVQVFTVAGEPIFTFGSTGTEPGKFSYPYGIEVASNGEIFVADSYNGNISVFDRNGNFLRYFAVHEEELTQPAGLHISGQHLYVANLEPGHVLVFDLETDELIRKVGSEGDGLGQLRFPNYAIVGPDGNLYVSDTANNRIQKYTVNGQFIETLDINSNLIHNPRGIVFGPKGQFLVASKLNEEVIIFDANFKPVKKFGNDVFNLPNGIAFDNRGRLYATDHISVIVFD